MPPASDAVAVTATVPLTVAPTAGLVSATVGGVVSCAAATVTCRLDEFVLLPALSNARATSETVMPAYVLVFQLTEYGLVASLPTSVLLA